MRRWRGRPIQDLVDGLRQLGVRIDCDSGCPPLTVYGGRLPGGTLSMRGDRSSQYFSALLLAAVLAEGPVVMNVTGTLVSRPYVDITRRMIEDFGGAVESTSSGFSVQSRAAYVARSYLIEPDASSASYPFALAAVTGGTITVPGLGRRALQGDYGFLDVLAQLGAQVEKGESSSTVTGPGAQALRGIAVDMHDISDTVMTLAAIAPVLSGETSISNVANIRIKETDRLIATVQELRRLGQGVRHGEDWLKVEPRPIHPATVQCYADHPHGHELCRPGRRRGRGEHPRSGLHRQDVPDVLGRPRGVLRRIQAPLASVRDCGTTTPRRSSACAGTRALCRAPSERVPQRARP